MKVPPVAGGQRYVCLVVLEASIFTGAVQGVKSQVKVLKHVKFNTDRNFLGIFRRSMQVGESSLGKIKTDLKGWTAVLLRPVQP